MHIVSIVLLLVVGLVSNVLSQSAGTCGNQDAVQLYGFQVGPKHPIPRPQLTSFSFDIDVLKPMREPIQVSVVLQWRVLGIWIKAPCNENGVGSCDYTSWCLFCKTCACDFVTGRQTLSMTMNVTTAVPTGEYKGELRFTSADGYTACFTMSDFRIV